MRALWLLSLLSGTALAEIVEYYPPEVPTSLVVQLSGGFTAKFSFAGNSTEEVTVTSGARKLVANLRGCGLTKNIHIVDMEIYHIDTRTGKPGDFATLLFDVGSDADIRFGKYPRVQLSWRAGQLSEEPLITRLIAEHHYYSDRLCPLAAAR